MKRTVLLFVLMLGCHDREREAQARALAASKAPPQKRSIGAQEPIAKYVAAARDVAFFGSWERAKQQGWVTHDVDKIAAAIGDGLPRQPTTLCNPSPALPGMTMTFAGPSIEITHVMMDCNGALKPDEAIIQVADNSREGQTRYRIKLKDPNTIRSYYLDHAAKK